MSAASSIILGQPGLGCFSGPYLDSLVSRLLNSSIWSPKAELHGGCFSAPLTKLFQLPNSVNRRVTPLAVQTRNIGVPISLTQFCEEVAQSPLPSDTWSQVKSPAPAVGASSETLSGTTASRFSFHSLFLLLFVGVVWGPCIRRSRLVTLSWLYLFGLDCA